MLMMILSNYGNSMLCSCSLSFTLALSLKNLIYRQTLGYNAHHPQPPILPHHPESAVSTPTSTSTSTFRPSLALTMTRATILVTSRAVGAVMLREREGAVAPVHLPPPNDRSIKPACMEVIGYVGREGSVFKTGTHPLNHDHLGAIDTCM